MKIEFIKEYCACFRDENGSINTETFKRGDTVSTSMEADRYFTEELAQWLIKNGFAEEVKESGWWKPKYGKRYYYLGEYGRIKVGTWNDCLWDNHLYAMGNVFRTEEAADRYCAYLKAEATVRQDEGVLTPMRVNELIKNEDLAYYVGYAGNRSNGEVLCGCIMGFDDCCMPLGVILFDTEEHADASCKKHPAEWRTILNYDWSKE